ncbi:MAG TPA: hypothetical protein VES39_00335, partial [Rhodospirillales bacterium]|nr:hypothetical protein [Rhodospirillales bacterium]
MTTSPRTGAALSDVERKSPPRLLVCGSGHRFDVVGEQTCHFSWDVDAPFDGVIIADASAAADMPTLLRRRRAWLAPVADLSGNDAWFADFHAADASPSSFRRAVAEMLQVIDALGQLPAAVTATGDEETLLLVRAFSRGGRLQPVYDGFTPDLLRYPAAGLLEQPAAAAELLCAGGWFDRTFFDRLHVCPRCASSRLNVREECSACRSPQVSQET